MDKKIIMFLAVFLLLPMSVFAEGYQTKEGFIIPEEDYNNLSLIYTEPYIYTMSYEEYENIKNLNLSYDSVQSVTKYIKTVYNTATGEVGNFEITEQEYNNAGYAPEARYGYYETNYKQLTLHLSRMGTDGDAYVSVTNIWKIMPATRSFDVIGVRLGNLTIRHGSESGRQTYKLNGNYESIGYSPEGTNIRYLHNGFGISMNIVDSNITELQNTISALLTIDALPAVAYGSYQHSQADISLATSRDYTIGAGGLGSVFKFNGNSGKYYDGMLGVYDNILS